MKNVRSREVGRKGEWNEELKHLGRVVGGRHRNEEGRNRSYVTVSSLKERVGTGVEEVGK